MSTRRFTPQFTDSSPAPASPRLLARVLRSRWAPLPVVLSGTFMVVLDFFIVNVALPSMQPGLRASSGAVEWVAADYALASAVFLITAGLRLASPDGELSFFSTVTTFGTAVDIIVSELAIEAFFPADAHTAQALGELVAVG